MPRSKNISVRVNPIIYDKFLKIVEDHTEVYEAWGSRKIYNYRDPLLPHQYDKFTIADLLEIAMKEYIDKRTKK